MWPARLHLQGALNIINNFGKKYRVIFNAKKTKLVVTDSKQDMAYYQDVETWVLDKKKIAVTNENEHLGLIVSGLNEEDKNMDVEDPLLECLVLAMPLKPSSLQQYSSIPGMFMFITFLCYVQVLLPIL